MAAVSNDKSHENSFNKQDHDTEDDEETEVGVGGGTLPFPVFNIAFFVGQHWLFREASTPRPFNEQFDEQCSSTTDTQG